MTGAGRASWRVGGLPRTFTKMSGAGNDFLVFGRKLPVGPREAETIRRLCRRGTGIGADGVLFVSRRERGAKLVVDLDYFNADGGPARFCANGTRCAARFAARAAGAEGPLTVMTGWGEIPAQVREDGNVTISLPEPSPDRRVDRLAHRRAVRGDLVLEAFEHRPCFGLRAGVLQRKDREHRRRLLVAPQGVAVVGEKSLVVAGELELGGARRGLPTPPVDAPLRHEVRIQVVIAGVKLVGADHRSNFALASLLFRPPKVEVPCARNDLIDLLRLCDAKGPCQRQPKARYQLLAVCPGQKKHQARNQKDGGRRTQVWLQHH
ncbi:hypothetical protein FBQ97_21075, partial [Acidobacteria bacterium ACD]|nr:hypothetical protein [Acidobacteria bacterium ACD]